MDNHCGSNRFSGNEIDLPAIIRSGKTIHTGYSISVEGKLEGVFIQCQNVDDDGTFNPELGNSLVSVTVLNDDVQPSSAIDAIRIAAPVTLNPIYIYTLNDKPKSKARLGIFFSGPETAIEAPNNFDWQKHAHIFESFSVYRIGENSSQKKKEYHSLNDRFYFPFLNNRGRYWPDVRITPPSEGSGLNDSFTAVLGAISRRSAITSDTQPLSLEWTGGSKVALVVRRMPENRCFYLEFDFPTRDQMKSGRFVIPGSIVGIVDPLQFAAELIAILTERAAGRLGLGGTECDCSG